MPIRWGIIGCGDVTEVKSGPAFAKADGSTLVAVMRRTARLAEDYARRHGVPRWYADAAALVTDPDVDAVYVATPPDGHRDGVLLAAQHRKPVYVEKPMALDHQQCLEMVAACATAGVPLFTAYYRRALPRFLRVKALLDDRAIGRARAVIVTLSRRHAMSPDSLPWRVDPRVAGGGLFVDLASHTLDLLDFLFGPIVSTVGGAANQGGFYEAEDIVTAAFEFGSGLRGAGVWSFAADRNEDRVEIIGSRGRLSFSTFDDVPVRVEREGQVEEFNIAHPPHVQQPLIQTVVDTLQGRGTCPSTGQSGARTTLVMDTLLASYYERARRRR